MPVSVPGAAGGADGPAAVGTPAAPRRDDSPYRPDVLGGDFVARTLTLADGLDGELVATLVRLAEPGHTTAVLYVHGFSDYFFQAEHAQAWNDAGYDFYALDLRRYGRSLRPHHSPGDVGDLQEYDEELSSALALVRAEGHDAVVLLAHSTGGLIASLYADRHPGSIDALVLNSPWFDLNEAPLRKLGSTPVARVLARRDPARAMAALGDAYGSSIHTSRGGAWDFDLAWKPLLGFPVRAGWLLAIRRGQRRLAQGLDIQVPILVCTSTRSGGTAGRTPTPAQLRSTDTVLDVRHMWRFAPSLGPDVTVRTIPGGLHDLALSTSSAREDYLQTVLAWLARRLAVPSP